VIDIEDFGDHSSLRMLVKSVAIERAGKLVFSTVDKQTWSVAK